MAFTKLEPTGVNTSATFTFANVSVTGNIITEGVSNLGPVSNVQILGGTSGYVLSTDGSGTLSWVAQTGGGGGSTYSNANVAAYLPTFTGELTAGNINVTGNVTSAYFVGNGSQLTGLPASYSNTNVASYLPTYTGNVSANYFIGNGSTLTNITGGNVNGTVASATIAATVTTNAQPNITSVGVLNGLSVSGNIIPTSNVIYDLGNTTNRFRDLYLSGTTIFLGEQSISSDGTKISFSGSLSGSGSELTDMNASNLSTGTISSTILGNSSLYVGTTSIALNRSSSSQSLTGVNIDGSASSATTAGTVTTNAQPNITSVGTLVDANISGNLFVGGNLVVNGATEYNNVTNLYVKDPIIEMGGNANAGALTSNDNKDRGTLLHYYTTQAVDAFMGWDNSNGEFAFGSNVTMVSDVATFNTFGNVRASYFLGNGSQLTGTVANANYAAYAGNVTIAAQPSITSVGTLSSLTVSGLITATAGGIKVGNLQDPSGTNTVQLLNSNVSVTGNIIAGSGGTGNVTATYFIGNGSQLTGISAGSTYSNSNVAAYLPTYTGNFTAGNGTVSGEFTVNGTLSAGAGTGGSITGANLISANYFSGNGSLLSSLNASNLASGTISGTILGNSTHYIGTTAIALNRSSGAQSLTGITSIDGYAATVSGAAQGNITSLGTLSSLSVSGLVTATAGGIKVGNIQDTAGTNTVQLSSGSIIVTGNITAGGGGTGNISGTNFIGSGASLTNLNASNIASGTIPSSILGNSTYYIGTTAITLNRGSASQSLTGITSIDGYASTVSTAAQPNITSTGTLTSLTVSGLTTLAETTEVVAVPTGTTYDTTLGSVFYVNQPGANFTPNFTNLPTTDNRISIVTLIINQSATPGMPTAIQIGGVSQTVKWPSGTISTGVASSVQTVSFAFLRYGAAWTVTASSGSYL